MKNRLIINKPQIKKDMKHNMKTKHTFWKKVINSVKFENGGLCGLKSQDGEILLKAEYDVIEVCADFIYAHYGKRHKFFYKNGSTRDCLDDERDFLFYENGKIGIKDSNGEVLFPAIYDEIIDWGEDCDVVYVRTGEEYHYYNHNKEEILTEADIYPEDRYPECPYNLGEDQNRNVLLCVEPISKRATDRDCFAFGQWVRLSQIRYSDIRRIFCDCAVRNVSANAIKLFEDRCTYIYSARKCTMMGETPLTACIEKFKTLMEYDVSWHYLLKITTNRNTQINPYDLYNVIKHFENIEYNQCLSFDIAIDYDEKLHDGEVNMIQVHYYWEDMGEFLDDIFSQVLLPNGSVEDIKNELKKKEPVERRKCISNAYWWIKYTTQRPWNETKKVLEYLKSEGCDNIDDLLMHHILVNYFYVENITTKEWAFRKKIVEWSKQNGAQLNKISWGKTLRERLIDELEMAKEYADAEALKSIKKGELFVDWLKSIGVITAAEQRAKIEKKLNGLSPNEVIELVRTI